MDPFQQGNIKINEKTLCGFWYDNFVGYSAAKMASGNFNISIDTKIILCSVVAKR